MTSQSVQNDTDCTVVFLRLYFCFFTNRLTPVSESQNQEIDLERFRRQILLSTDPGLIHFDIDPFDRNPGFWMDQKNPVISGFDGTRLSIGLIMVYKDYK